MKIYDVNYKIKIFIYVYETIKEIDYSILLKFT